MEDTMSAHTPGFTEGAERTEGGMTYDETECMDR